MIIPIIFILGLTAILVYLSISDIKSHEIPLVASIIGLIFTFLMVLINSLILPNSKELPQFSDALFGLLVGGGLTAIIVIISKERAMGSGDIILFGTMGLAVGLSNLLLGFMICVYSATIYGIFLAIRKKKFKGLEIPMVPFISAGIIITLLFNNEISGFLNKLTLLSL